MNGERSVKRGRLHLNLTTRRSLPGYVFILPWMLGFLLFFAWPLILSFVHSLNDLKMSATGFAYRYIGFDNYAFMLLRDPQFVPMLTEAVLNMLYEVPLIILFSLFIAVLLNQKFFGRTFFRSAFFLPVIITSGVVYVMLQGIINGNSLGSAENAYIFRSAGLAETLASVGVPAFLIVAIRDIVNRVFALTMKSGVQILMFLSGLQKIPASSYEAARIEGATGWDAFWRITVPLTMPIMLLNVIYSIIDSFMAYGTEHSGNRVLAAIYRTGFGGQSMFGLAASMSWIYMAVVALMLCLVYWMLGKAAASVES